MLSFIEFIKESGEYYHVTPHKNVESIKKSGLIPQIGDRSKKMKEKSAVFLFKHKDDADNATMNWLGDEFDDDERLSLLKVKLPSHIKAHKGEVDYEHQVFHKIHPKHISVENDNY